MQTSSHFGRGGWQHARDRSIFFLFRKSLSKKQTKLAKTTNFVFLVDLFWKRKEKVTTSRETSLHFAKMTIHTYLFAGARALFLQLVFVALPMVLLLAWAPPQHWLPAATGAESDPRLPTPVTCARRVPDGELLCGAATVGRNAECSFHGKLVPRDFDGDADNAALFLSRAGDAVNVERRRLKCHCDDFWYTAREERTSAWLGRLSNNSATAAAAAAAAADEVNNNNEVNEVIDHAVLARARAVLRELMRIAPPPRGCGNLDKFLIVALAAGLGWTGAPLVALGFWQAAAAWLLLLLAAFVAARDIHNSPRGSDARRVAVVAANLLVRAAEDAWTGSIAAALLLTYDHADGSPVRWRRADDGTANLAVYFAVALPLILGRAVGMLAIERIKYEVEMMQ